MVIHPLVVGSSYSSAFWREARRVDNHVPGPMLAADQTCQSKPPAALGRALPRAQA